MIQLPKEIVVIRHGIPDAIHGLSAEGRRQALRARRKLATTLKQAETIAVLASDLPRAVATAEVIAGGREGLEVEAAVLWRELSCNLGATERAWAELVSRPEDLVVVVTHQPDLLMLFMLLREDGYHSVESWGQFLGVSEGAEYGMGFSVQVLASDRFLIRPFVPET